MAFFSPSLSDPQKKQLGLAQGQAGSLFGNAQNLFGGINAGYQNILNSPGYTPSQVSNLYTGALQPISGAYGSASGNLQRTAARTRNDAGLYSGADALARSAAQGMGPAASKVATQVADYPREQQFKALSGMENLYGPSLSAGTSLSGQAGNIANNPSSPSIFSDILGTAGAAGGLMTGIGGFGGGAAPSLRSGYPPGQMPQNLLGRAKGGRVKKGKAYLVGEKGAEIFRPGQSGRIIPNLYAA
jgi:hypothetical protein